MTTEEVGCLRSDVGRQKAEVGTTELRRETNTNLTDDTNMRELRRETNTNLTDGTNMRDHGDERWLRADVRGLKSDGRSIN